ncbi:MAG: hypothetical protein HY820_11335 [Acidobacteria bacterium]|nr:hypothetical protein [Acidobacteriota bacterium]
MARLATVLKALLRIGARDGKTLGSFSGNNLFYLAVALLFMSDAKAFVSLNVILLITLFFPLSTDPLRKIPASRLAAWPLRRGELRGLRLITPWLNPITWVLASLVLLRTVSMGLWATLAGLFAFGFVMPSLRLGGHGRLWPMPPFPTRFGVLVKANLRQMLATLDFYCALLLACGAAVYRFSGAMPVEARVPLTLLIVLALSSYAQSLFGLDGTGAMTRYRLLPLRGWQVLLAKDAVVVAVDVLLCLPLAPLPALSAALMGLALGHGPSVRARRPQTRWRFTAATSFGPGIVQVILMILAATATAFASVGVVAGCGVLWGVSLWRGGRWLENGAEI